VDGLICGIGISLRLHESIGLVEVEGKVSSISGHTFADSYLFKIALDESFPK
jgi:hypothetical protein